MTNTRTLYAGILVILSLSVLVAGCTTSPSASPTPAATAALQKTQLTVFAAASLSDAFNETAAAYEARHPGVDVQFNFAGTQLLKTQVEQGAAADVFASASAAYMTALKNEGYVNNSTAANFTKNKLAIIVPKSNPANITGMSGLAKPGVKLVVCGPSVPCGGYTLQVLNKSAANASYGPGFNASVMKNVVSQETDVNQAISKVALGEADAAFVYKSDVPEAMQDKVTTLTIPESLNVVVTYPIAVLKQSKDQADSRDFVNFVLSPDGQAILSKHGFITG